jgi:hypothetical protein
LSLRLQIRSQIQHQEVKVVRDRLKQFNDAGARQEKKLRSGHHTIAKKEKMERNLAKLHSKVEDNRIKCFEVNRAKNVILAVS